VVIRGVGVGGRAGELKVAAPAKPVCALTNVGRATWGRPENPESGSAAELLTQRTLFAAAIASRILCLEDQQDRAIV
jgi:hypothetical protein